MSKTYLKLFDHGALVVVADGVLNAAGVTTYTVTICSGTVITVGSGAASITLTAPLTVPLLATAGAAAMAVATYKILKMPADPDPSPSTSASKSKVSSKRKASRRGKAAKSTQETSRPTSGLLSGFLSLPTLAYSAASRT